MILSVKNLSKKFASARAGEIRAVNDLSFEIRSGEILGIVGESGSGKTTLARLILNLIRPSAGQVHFKGKNIHQANSREIKEMRKKMQVVFQNPYASLNPRLRAGEIISEPLIIHKTATKKAAFERSADLLKKVGLGQDDVFKYPYQFSAGQRQRIAIARAIILEPEFLVLDEPVSSLDVTIQKQILELLLELKRRQNLTFLFISHDIKIISNISSHIGVMKEGQLVELGKTEEVLSQPQNEYTRKLLEFVL